MNVKIVYAGRVDSWDTRADGSASTSHAVLRVRGQDLQLWSDLRFEEDYDPDGDAQKSRVETGSAVAILRLSADSRAPQDLAGWLAAAHDELGVLRLDVDGETLYQYEEPTKKGGGKKAPRVWAPNE